jgi:predicted amidohydrolase
MSGNSIEPVAKMAVRNPRIGIIQLHIPERCTTVGQYERAVGFIREAADKGADIVILPEMFLGFHPTSPEQKDAFAADCFKCIQSLRHMAKVGC